MKIAIVVEWLDPARGGAETSTRQFIDRLIERGIAVELFTRSPIPSAAGMNVHVFQSRKAGRGAGTAAFIEWAQKQIASSDCDLSHAFIPCLGADFYQPRGGLTAETIIRTAATRPTAAGRFLKTLAMRFNTRQRFLLNMEHYWLTSDRRPIVIAISNYVVQQLRDHYQYPDSHIRHVLNGVDITPAAPDERERNRNEIRRRFGVGQDDLLLLTVAHNYRLKGVAPLLEAVGQVVRRGKVKVKALVVGREAPQPWRRMAHRFGAGDAVVFTGPSDRIECFFHAADVLIHPTYYDPCSRVVLEAISHGLAIIGTRYDGATEVLEDGVSGFVLLSPAFVDLTVINIEALADPARRRKMAEAAGKQAAHVTMRRHADQVVSLYQDFARRAPMGIDGATVFDGSR